VRRFIFPALILIPFALSLALAVAVQQALLSALSGAALTVVTVAAADLAATRLRRRARRTLLPAAPATNEEPVAPKPEPEVEEEPKSDQQDLWNIPALSEEEDRGWASVTPLLDEPEEPEHPPAAAGADEEQARPDNIVGCNVGPYQVLEQVGQGGMAAVYKGYHPELERHVAIKVLDRALTRTPELARRFRREARTIAALRHPNIVQVYDFGPLDDTHYLAMEYVEGSDLQAEIDRRQAAGHSFAPDEILDLLAPIAEALDYAHQEGVIHRDVKPGNILLTRDGQPILTDFGLAALRRTRATLITTVGRDVLGTPEYAAPEQALDAQAAGPQSDVYSLGCILYELSTGHLPFEAESPLSIALMHISEEPTPPRQHVPDLLPEVEAVILQSLAKAPEDRFSTAGILVEALRQAWTLGAAAENAPPPPASPATLSGLTIGPYEVQTRIGRGGMATVYKALHPELDRHVAIKVLARQPGDTPKLARRFRQEARTIAALRHPNIVQIHDFGSLDDTYYLVMEYVVGTTLQAILAERKENWQAWAPAEVLALVEQIGAALDYAHEHGIVHRDVKPSNLLVTEDGHYILADFGISAVRRDRTTLASTLGHAFGTPEYTAPEQAADYRAAVPQSDLYSLACIVYEMITNRLVFESPSAMSLALMHISHDPIPPTTYAPDLPPAVETVILRMLAKEPDRRLQTGAALTEALRSVWGVE
jgi:serine/threonine protein kinase